MYVNLVWDSLILLSHQLLVHSNIVFIAICLKPKNVKNLRNFTEVYKSISKALGFGIGARWWENEGENRNPAVNPPSHLEVSLK